MTHGRFRELFETENQGDGKGQGGAGYGKEALDRYEKRRYEIEQKYIKDFNERWGIDQD